MKILHLQLKAASLILLLSLSTYGFAQKLDSYSLEATRSAIAETLKEPVLSSAHTAIKVLSLDSGKVIYEENASKLMQPASVLKIFGVGTALAKLGPDFRFVTSVYSTARPDAQGAVEDLTIYGRGDPTIAAKFYDGNYYRAMDEIAEKIYAAGVRKINGDLIGNQSYFTGPPFSPAWTWEDLQWYYGAEVSALSVNDNAVDLYIAPGLKEGDPCIITMGPQTDHVKIINRTTTVNITGSKELAIYRPLGENVIEVTGSLRLDEPNQFAGSLAVSRPAQMFVNLLRASLEKKGILVSGQSRVDSTALNTSGLIEIANRPSPVLSEIAARTLKTSNNLYTELIIRALAGTPLSLSKRTSLDLGLDVVKGTMFEAGIVANSHVMKDGAGLSRSDLITAETIVKFLIYMSNHRHSNSFRDALAIAGVDGTLRSRMVNTPAAGNVRAKTGTLNSVSGLAGYVKTAAGERLAFAILFNDISEETLGARYLIDEITVLLARLNQRSN
jgi:serine-type D-Ala-D-Ala carboxypeptidase/endopeptidase (penicillin-binding protein 4)